MEPWIPLHHLSFLYRVFISTYRRLDEVLQVFHPHANIIFSIPCLYGIEEIETRSSAKPNGMVQPPLSISALFLTQYSIGRGYQSWLLLGSYLLSVLRSIGSVITKIRNCIQKVFQKLLLLSPFRSTDFKLTLKVIVIQINAGPASLLQNIPSEQNSEFSKDLLAIFREHCWQTPVQTQINLTSSSIESLQGLESSDCSILNSGSLSSKSSHPSSLPSETGWFH